jgi:lipoate-protein ligase A
VVDGDGLERNSGGGEVVHDGAFAVPFMCPVEIAFDNLGK